MTITSSPWGKPDFVKDIGAGILRIDTPSHGGYFIPPQLNALVPAAWRMASFNQQGRRGWYEEDCDWALVALTFPTTFPAHAAEHARRTFDAIHAPKIAGTSVDA